MPNEFQLYRSVSDLQLAERLFALFPKSEQFYIVLAYFDESEQQREALNAACISAVTGTGLQWANVTGAWEKVLVEYDACDKKGRRVFHTVEFETPEGRAGTVYEKWTEEKRRAFNRALLDAFAHSGIQAIAPSVMILDYKEVAERLIEARQALDPSGQYKYFENKYCFLALFAMLFAGHEAVKYYPKGEQAAYYFESGGGYRDFVDSIYLTTINDQKLSESFRFASAPNFVAKDFAAALQVADKIAYEVSKHVSHYHDPNPPIQHSELLSGNLRWKTRYAMLHLNARGFDIKIPFWRKDELEDFFNLSK